MIKYLMQRLSSGPVLVTGDNPFYKVLCFTANHQSPGRPVYGPGRLYGPVHSHQTATHAVYDTHGQIGLPILTHEAGYINTRSWL